MGCTAMRSPRKWVYLGKLSKAEPWSSDTKRAGDEEDPAKETGKEEGNRVSEMSWEPSDQSAERQRVSSTAAVQVRKEDRTDQCIEQHRAKWTFSIAVLVE